MTLIQKVKLALKLRRPINKMVTEVEQMKSGYKTTEFWLTVISNLITIAGALQGVIDAKTAAVMLAVLNGVYSVLRTVAKANGQPVPPEPPKN